MNINVGIIDQHVRGLATRLRSRLEEELGKLDDTKARSVSFVLLCAKTMLQLTEDEAIEALTEGGNDFGVDAASIGDAVNGEFTVTLFQGKYHHEDLRGERAYPQSAVEKAIQAVASLFNPHAKLHLNPRLATSIEDVRGLIVDGNIPRVRFLLCSNGAEWKHPESQALIDNARFPDTVEFQHVSHDTLVRALGSSQPIKDTIQFTGRTLVEDLNYVRVLIGKVSVSEIARLMTSHGDRLLDRNVRRYLGLIGNRINEGIRATLRDGEDRLNFFFYNNGLTLICERFDHNALQPEHHRVRAEGLQIINGAQTSKTIQLTVDELQQESSETCTIEQAHVLVRLYQVPRDAGPDAQRITCATNNQNPVDLRDLRSGDKKQRELELAVQQLGYEYRRQRSEQALTAKDITVATAAEAVLAVWRERPQRAKFRGGDHFGTLYEEIFTDDLNAAQVVIAVLLFRIAENKRKRPPANAPESIRYSSYFAAMLMGRKLLVDLGIGVAELDHRRFDAARSLLEEHAEQYFQSAISDIELALAKLYGEQPVSAHRLAATFRRGDLFEHLPRIVSRIRRATPGALSDSRKPAKSRKLQTGQRATATTPSISTKLVESPRRTRRRRR